MVSKKKRYKCKKGYNCGLRCISVKKACRKEGLKGQYSELGDNYFKLALAKSRLAKSIETDPKSEQKSGRPSLEQIKPEPQVTRAQDRLDQISKLQADPVALESGGLSSEQIEDLIDKYEAPARPSLEQISQEPQLSKAQQLKDRLDQISKLQADPVALDPGNLDAGQLEDLIDKYEAPARPSLEQISQEPQLARIQDQIAESDDIESALDAMRKAKSKPEPEPEPESDDIESGLDAMRKAEPQPKPESDSAIRKPEPKEKAEFLADLDALQKAGGLSSLKPEQLAGLGQELLSDAANAGRSEDFILSQVLANKYKSDHRKWLEEDGEGDSPHYEKFRTAFAASRAAYYDEPVVARDLPARSDRPKVSDAVPSAIERGNGTASKETMEFLDNAELIININPRGIAGLFNDGRFKNGFERGARGVGGSDSEYKKQRKEVEEARFGIPKSAKPKDRPMYGHLEHPDRLGTRMQKMQDMYGDIQLILNDEIKDRSSFVYDDSLDYGAEKGMKGTPIRDPKLPEGMRPGKTVEDWRDGKFKSGPGYLEAQIYGGLNLGDIKAIRVPNTKPFPLTNAQLEEIEQAGIKLIIEKDFPGSL